MDQTLMTQRVSAQYSYLTQSEVVCLKVAVRYSRRKLLFDLIDWEGYFPEVWRHSLIKGAWLARFVACLILPVMMMLALGLLVSRFLLIPARWLLIGYVPRSLPGPGERNLNGLYKALRDYCQWRPQDVALVMSQWIVCLYGAAAAEKYSFAVVAQQVANSQRQAKARVLGGELPMRHVHEIARERLSSLLGHYSAIKSL